MYRKSYVIPRDSAACYEQYYLNQTGAGMPVYRGSTGLQRGYGLGGLLGGLFRSAMPVLKKGAMAVGREALQSGIDIAQDVMRGQNVKTAAKKRIKTAGRNMGRKALNKLQKGKGRGKQNLKPQKRGKKRRRKNQLVSSRGSKRGRRSHNDIFG